MCGIFTLLNNEYQFENKFIKQQFEKGKNRGPENSSLTNSVKSIFGFHRLAINGLNDISNQPIVINDITLICNGEIYNYKELYNLMGIKGKTQSDCEVIIHLYMNYGIDQTLTMLDGVFSFVLLDNRIHEKDLTSKIYVARDPFGVRPLYILAPKMNDDYNPNFREFNIIGFASEIKVLSEFFNKLESLPEYEYFFSLLVFLAKHIRKILFSLMIKLNYN
jgi:asparagine synthase (glutamine-hydrolysing)